MKKHFFYALAVAALFTALPFAVSATAQTQEMPAPGYNILTGSTDVWKCDNTDFPDGVSVEGGTVGESPVKGDNGNSAFVCKPTGKYNWLSIRNDKYNYPKERAYKVSFKTYKSADDGYGTDANLWIMKNGGAGWQVVESLGNFAPNSDSWKENTYVLKKFGKLYDNNGALDTSEIERFIIQWARDSKDEQNIHETAYFDDISIIPSYKITYCDTDGSFIREEYDYFDEESFEPTLTDEDKALYRVGWSVENDKTADAAVALNHEDVVLYAVYDENAYVTVDGNSSLLTAAGKTAKLTAEYRKYGDTSVPKLSYSVISGEDTVKLTDNGDGTATVTSVKEGVAKIRCYTEQADVFSEIYLLSDYSADGSCVRIFYDSDRITEDAGTLDIDARVFYENAPSQNVEWKCASEAAWLQKNGDGSATLTAIHNGSVDITAYENGNSSVKAVLTVEITGQLAKTASYSFRYYAVGNSFLIHSPLKGWSDTGGMGMAASEPSKDYFNQIQKKLSENFYSSITADRKSMSGFEGMCEPGTTKQMYEDSALFIDFQNTIRSYKPNILTIQLSENIKTDDVQALSLFYDTLYGMVSREKPENCVVVCVSPKTEGNKYNTVKKYAEKYRFEFADTLEIGKLGESRDNPYLAFMQYPDDSLALAGGVEFRTHPGDLGMEYIADSVVECLKSAIPASIPADYRYIPESITITGADSVSEEGKSAAYDVIIAPAKAEKSIIWSVDNKNIATISEDGVLTALNNGTVTITAKYAYDTTICAEKKVEITGQTEHFTLTYAAGTDDTVTNLPDADEYAKGKYVLSSQAPARAGYKFSGWALEENGSVVTEINVSADTTVYAVWEFAYFWNFDTDGYAEGVNMNAFNVTVKDGTLNGIAYQTGLSFSADNLLINAEDYETFTFTARASGDESNQKYTVLLKTSVGDKEFSAEIPDSSMRTFSFDIKGLSGTITGFNVKVSMKDCTVSVDEIAFVRKTSAAVEKETTIRVKDPMGLRFKASIDNSEKSEAAQYGFIVARASELRKGELNHTNMKNGTIKAVEGIAYDRAEDIDVIFGFANDKTVFAAALTNIPEKRYLEKISVRAFVKRADRYSYSEVYTGSLAETAQKIKNENGELYKSNAQLIDGILETARNYEMEFDISDLYK